MSFSNRRAEMRPTHRKMRDPKRPLQSLGASRISAPTTTATSNWHVNAGCRRQMSWIDAEFLGRRRGAGTGYLNLRAIIYVRRHLFDD